MGDSIPQFPERKDKRPIEPRPPHPLGRSAPQLNEHYSYATEKLLKEIRDEFRLFNLKIEEIIMILSEKVQ